MRDHIALAAPRSPSPGRLLTENDRAEELRSLTRRSGFRLRAPRLQPAQKSRAEHGHCDKHAAPGPMPGSEQQGNWLRHRSVDGCQEDQFMRNFQ